MISWFAKDAPLRTKFDVMAVLYMSYMAIAASPVLLGAGKITTLAILGGSGLATLATALLTKKMICDPIIATVLRMEWLADGDVKCEIRHTDHQDCVGRMTRALAIFRDNAEQVRRAAKSTTDSSDAQKRIVTALGTGLRALSSGDLQYQITDSFPAEYEELRRDYNRAMSELAEALSAVNSATMGVRTGADEIRKASNDLSNRTEQQAASLEQTTAALDVITSTVRQTAGDAQRADESAVHAREEAQQSGDTVRKAVTAMTGIERTSREIAEIISVIDGIAFQTNLLALNAGVEAARAGDAGKGFAVVASEVRVLAGRSADAAKDIRERIAASAKEVDAGVKLVGAAGEALDRIISRIGEVSTLVSTIATAADTQAQGLVQVNSAMNEMDKVTQQNAAMVEEATAAAHSLRQEAVTLGEQMAHFRFDGGARSTGYDGRRLAA